MLRRVQSETVWDETDLVHEQDDGRLSEPADNITNELAFYHWAQAGHLSQRTDYWRCSQTDQQLHSFG